MWTERNTYLKVIVLTVFFQTIEIEKQNQAQ